MERLEFSLRHFFQDTGKRDDLQEGHQLWEDEHPEAIGRAGQNLPIVVDAIPQADPQWDLNN